MNKKQEKSLKVFSWIEIGLLILRTIGFLAIMLTRG